MELWAQFQSASLSDSERHELLQWPEQSAQHQLAWQQAQESWALMGQIYIDSLDLVEIESSVAKVTPMLSSSEVQPVSYSGLTHWARNWLAMSACLLLCVTGLIFLPDFIWNEQVPQVLVEQNEVPVEHYRNDLNVKYQVILADGSVSFLNINTEIEVRYRESRRHIVLQRGEAYFQVTKDPSRPFTVSAGSTSATAIGTAFVVRRSNKQETLVVVTEGQVEVAEAEAPQTVLLGADQSVVSKANEVFQVKLVDAKHMAAWHQGALIFDDVPLSEVLAEIDRYTLYDIKTDFSGWSEKRLSGTLFIDEIDKEIGALVNSFHLQVVSNGNGTLVLAAPPLRRPN